MIYLLLLMSMANADTSHKHLPPCPMPKLPVVQPIQPQPITVNNQTNNQVVNYNIESPADNQTHLAAHLGTAFAIQTVVYGINRQIGMSKLNSELLGLAETLVIGLVYKNSEGASRADKLKATEENALGAGMAIMTHLTFSF